jgi:hypothetical protein
MLHQVCLRLELIKLQLELAVGVLAAVGPAPL